MLPAAGQGALGIEVPAADAGLVEELAGLAHGPTWLAALAERAVSRGLGGSCSVPLAAYASWGAEASGQGAQLQLRSALGAVEDPRQPLLRAEVSAPVKTAQEAEALGAQVVDQLVAAGARSYLATPNKGNDTAAT
jgi:hydroxymethylbilane synthase